MTAELGLEAEARATFDALAVDDFAGVPVDQEWMVSVSFLAEAASALADASRAAILYRLARPYADRVAVSYPEISTGAFSRSLGIMARTIGDGAGAAAHFEAAMEINSRIGARAWLARAMRDYADMLRSGPSVGDRRRAEALLAEAAEIQRRLEVDPAPARTRRATR
jgi:hypothetical protein